MYPVAAFSSVTYALSSLAKGLVYILRPLLDMAEYMSSFSARMCVVGDPRRASVSE